MEIKKSQNKIAILAFTGKLLVEKSFLLLFMLAIILNGKSSESIFEFAKAITEGFGVKELERLHYLLDFKVIYFDPRKVWIS